MLTSNRKPLLNRTRVHRLLLGAFVVITFIWLFPSSSNHSNGPSASGSGSYRWWRRHQAPTLLERQRTFWQAFRRLLESTAPGCPPPKQDEKVKAVNFDSSDSFERPNLIQMPMADVLKARDAHTDFVEKVRASDELKPVFVPGTRGVVYTAGGTYLPVFVVSLRMFRRTGSNLPAELFLKDRSEYEPNICEEVLPSLNARCVVLSDIIDSTNNPPPSSSSPPSSFSSSENVPEIEISHYQLKIFAMLFSSFDEVIWIDADCFPLHAPEKLLDDEPYKSTGMVTWPDYWASTVSIEYYLISQQPPPSMMLRASSETGEILLSKSSHPLTLLLTTYYNYYGPSHYFRLLSQGAPGEGDKETFIQAALAVGEKFHATVDTVKPIGHRTDGGGISGSAMVQFDPVQDYHYQRSKEVKRERARARANGKTSKKNTNKSPPPPPPLPRVFFLHAHFPKFNPATVFEDQGTKPTYGPDGKTHSRAWIIPEDVIDRFGYDVERQFWKEIKWVACHLENSFRTWSGKTGICAQVKQYWKDVFGKR